MIEAALNYEQAHDQLGGDFLDDIQHAIDAVREHPKRVIYRIVADESLFQVASITAHDHRRPR